MTAPTDERIFAVSLYDRDPSRPAVGVLRVVADRGRMTLTLGENGKRPAASFDLNETAVDHLLNSLPKLRDWMASGAPATY